MGLIRGESLAGRGRDIQESKREDEDNGEFRAGIHLHFPYKKNRKDAERPVCYSRHSAVSVGNSGKGSTVQAVTLSVCVVFRPEVADGAALEDEEEEIHGAEDHNDGEGGVDDNLLVPFAGEAEEVGGYGDLGDGCGYHVEELTDEYYLRHVSWGRRARDACV